MCEKGHTTHRIHESLAMSVFSCLWQPPPRARTGGRWQRIAAERTASPIVPCNIVLRHLDDWSGGDISGIHLRRHMDSLLVDGFDHPSIRKLHGCGRSNIDQNSNHNVLKLLVATLSLDELLTPVLNCLIRTVVKPSSIFHWIHKHNRAVWGRIFGADEVELFTFWGSLFVS